MQSDKFRHKLGRAFVDKLFGSKYGDYSLTMEFITTGGLISPAEHERLMKMQEAAEIARAQALYRKAMEAKFEIAEAVINATIENRSRS